MINSWLITHLRFFGATGATGIFFAKQAERVFIHENK
jgi:hypothetical protein